MLPSPIQLVFCKKNLELHSQTVYDAISRDYPHAEIEIKDCVDHCGTCTDVPFAIRNSGLIGGRDARDLYRKLVRGMQFLERPKLPGTAGYEEAQDTKAPIGQA